MKKSESVVFLGSKRLGLRVLQTIHRLAPDRLLAAITIDDSADGRSARSDFQDFATAASIPLHVAKNRKHADELIADLRPDLCLVVGWYWLFDRVTLERVPNGFIGVHNSLLPKYRGSSPLVWTMICGESEAGFSIFSFTPGMDDGPLWFQGRVAVSADDRIGDVLDRLERDTLDAFTRIYVPLLDAQLEPTAQTHEHATYCAARRPADGCIDWRWSDGYVHNFIRAQSDPYPAAFTYLEGKMLKIWRAHPFASPYAGTPGQIARIGQDGVYVVCGNHRAVILDEVEVDQRRGEARQMITSLGRLAQGPHG